jgi:low affinity Fe/Cu permease
MKKNHRRQPAGKHLKDGNSFQRFARAAARTTGRPLAFGIALCAVIVWAILGPIFHFSDTWQLVINTATTIITFLIVFLIQNTQNRDSEAIQIKLDELLRATHGCHNVVLDIEELSETELDEIKRSYSALAKKALQELRNGKSDLGIPDMDPDKVTSRERS